MAVDAFRSRMGSALANRDVAEVEAAWREWASLHPDEYGYLLTVAEQLTRQDKGALASELCMALAESQLERGDAAAGLEAARAALKASQKTEGLREILVAAYQARHGGNPHLDLFLEKSGLSDESGSLRQHIDALDRYLTFEEGSYVFHAGGWGYGIVTEFDASEEEMVVDFQQLRGHRISLLNATKILQRLPEDHIGVYLHFRREELQQLMESDPARVFHIFLTSHGGKANLKQARESFVPDMLDKSAWSRWWGRAKKALLKDPNTRVGKGSSPLLELRDTAKTIEREVAERMQARATGVEKVAVAREYLRTLDLTPELAEAVSQEVDAGLEAAREAGDTAAQIALLYLRGDVRKETAEEAREEVRRILAAHAGDFVGLVAPLEAAERKRAVQDFVATGNPAWADALLGLLQAGDAEAADVVLEALRSRRPDLLIGFFAELTSQPHKNPELYLWYVRGFMNKAIPLELAPGEKETSMVEKLLTLANQIGLEQRRSGDENLKEFLRHLRSFLTTRRLRTFRAFVADTSPDYARFLFAKIQRNRGFTDQTRQALLDVIESEHPDLHTVREEAPRGEVRLSDDVVHTTLEGYRRKEAEMRTILEVDIPANAAELGRAASFGDISENAEYSAALDKQEHIMRRLRELRDALDKARILEPEQVTLERVVLGTRVRLRNLSAGTEESFSILGPWDVDLEQGIISYRSPVGRGLLGKTPGTSVTIELPEGTVDYEVLGIEIAPSLLKQGS